MTVLIQVASLRSANKHTPNPKTICTKGCEFCANPLAKSSHPNFCVFILFLVGLGLFCLLILAYSNKTHPFKFVFYKFKDKFLDNFIMRNLVIYLSQNISIVIYIDLDQIDKFLLDNSCHYSIP